MRFANYSAIALTTFLLALLFAWVPNPCVAQDDDPFGQTNESNANPFGQEPLVKVAVSQQANSKPMAARRQNKTRILTAEDIEEKLKMPMSFEYDEVAFIEVMDELSDHFGINVVLDQSARDDSLTEDELITCKLKNMTLSNALQLVLKEKNATYMVGPGYLKIISMDVAQDPEFHRRQIFDCRNLLAKIAVADKRVGKAYPVQNYRQLGRGFSGAPGGGGVFNVAPQIGGGGLGGGGRIGLGGGGRAVNKNVYRSAEHQIIQTGQAPEILQKPDVKQNGASQENTVEVHVLRVTAEGLLMELIKSSIEADSWSDSNGDATISIIGGLMVVTHDQGALEEIERFLTELDQRMR